MAYVDLDRESSQATAKERLLFWLNQHLEEEATTQHFPLDTFKGKDFWEEQEPEAIQ